MAYLTQTRFALSSMQRGGQTQEEAEAMAVRLCMRDNSLQERFVLLAAGLDPQKLSEFLAPPHEIVLPFCCWFEADVQKALRRRSLLAVIDTEGHIGCWIIQCTQEESIQIAAE